MALAAEGYKVGILDADIFGPSLPKMFGLEGAELYMHEVDGRNLIIPAEAYGVKMLSIGFLIDPGNAPYGVESMASFIKMQFFGKPFKVFTVDENTRVFIDRLSSLNSQIRTIGVSYDTLVKTLRENFTEKKAMTALYKLEQLTIELVKVNGDIVDLANKFDERWLQKSR